MSITHTDCVINVIKSNGSLKKKEFVYYAKKKNLIMQRVIVLIVILRLSIKSIIDWLQENSILALPKKYLINLTKDVSFAALIR